MTLQSEVQRHRQAQADAVFDSIGQGAIATDTEGKINRINQSALDLLGYKRAEMIGRWFPEAVVAEDAAGHIIPPLNRPITQSFLTGKAVTGQTFYRRKMGDSIPVSVTVSPVMLQGRPIGAVEVFRDISQEVAIEVMKTEFIYLASHQLRTPLTGIKTYSHMLDEGYYGKLTDGQHDALQNILLSVNRMNDTISTLLNISRLEAGKLTITPAPVSIAQLARQTLGELRPAIESKSLHIRTKFPKHRPILTDPSLVKEICLNLLSNAIKYTPTGGAISISVNSGGRTLRVQDSGYGIPMASQKHIFTKFYRAPNIIDMPESGTGLGLYLVKGLAEALGGRVWFQSKQHQGSTFYLELPFRPPT